RTYLGEVLDIYKKTGGRHGSLTEATTIAGLSYLSLRVYLPLKISGTQEHSDEESASEDSEKEENGTDQTAFSCRVQSAYLHTHARGEDLVYHLGPNAATGKPGAMVLKDFEALRWRVLTKPKVQKTLTIRIPAKDQLKK
ncbi:hypothetical protein C8Q80DRAFT_1111610, partial [Daedaleopsis nitida]